MAGIINAADLGRQARPPGGAGGPTSLADIFRGFGSKGREIERQMEHQTAARKALISGFSGPVPMPIKAQERLFAGAFPNEYLRHRLTNLPSEREQKSTQALNILLRDPEMFTSAGATAARESQLDLGAINAPLSGQTLPMDSRMEILPIPGMEAIQEGAATAPPIAGSPILGPGQERGVQQRAADLEFLKTPEAQAQLDRKKRQLQVLAFPGIAKEAEEAHFKEEAFPAAPFKSVRMQMPGTNFYRQVLSLSDYETAVADGMVDSQTGDVPGAKSNQLELPWDMIMGPGGKIIPRPGTDSELNRKMAEEKRERLIRADKALFDNADYSFTTLMDKAMQLKNDPDLRIISGAYDALTLSLLPTAKKLEGRIETLKSNLALAAIQSARQGSASGATGFGSMSAPELAILQTKITAIDPSAGTDVLKGQLQDVFDYAETLRGKLRDGYGFKGGPDAWTIRKESNETIKRIESGELT